MFSILRQVICVAVLRDDRVHVPVIDELYNSSAAADRVAMSMARSNPGAVPSMVARQWHSRRTGPRRSRLAGRDGDGRDDAPAAEAGTGAAGESSP